jgi:hypothetical protein
MPMFAFCSPRQAELMIKLIQEFGTVHWLLARQTYGQYLPDSANVRRSSEQPDPKAYFFHKAELNRSFCHRAQSTK